MSDLVDLGHCASTLRAKLLVGVSTLAALGSVWTSANAIAQRADQDRPTVWIELGGQLERVDGATATFSPHFFNLASPEDVATMTGAQRPSRYAIGGEGRIIFEPRGTDWVFSAEVRYGRSNNTRHLHHETAGFPNQYFTVGGAPFAQYTPVAKEFSDGQTARRDTHVVLDFLAGKDVGLGLFGIGSKSVFSAGVRFAQFTSGSDVSLHARPVNDVLTKYSPGVYRLYNDLRRTYTAVLHTEHNSRAVGPSVSWDASAIIARSDNDSELSFDWGMNAAVLFGRQHAQSQHQTEGRYLTGLLAQNTASTSSYNGPNRVRSRAIVIPILEALRAFRSNFLTPNLVSGIGEISFLVRQTVETMYDIKLTKSFTARLHRLV